MSSTPKQFEVSGLDVDAAQIAAPLTAGSSTLGEIVDESSESFSVRLANFEGPFDLLLSLIAKRQMDVTEVALSQVTDEFISYLRLREEWDLGQATQFLVVAATLLDLKIARLLPSAEVEDEEDLALLEARDLLFARLLQYRAYKLAAAYLAELDANAALHFGRAVELDPEFAGLLPEIEIGVSPERFALVAARTLAPRPVPVVGTDHVHAARVSVAEHMEIMRDRIRQSGSATFRRLVADCGATLEVVARFLGLLELYREGSVAFDQVTALGELRVRWVAPSTEDAVLTEMATGDDGVEMIAATMLGQVEGETQPHLGADLRHPDIDEEYG